MARIAELPDGRRLEFPDDTPDDVIQAAVRRELGVVAQPAAPSEPTPGQRTREQRLTRIAELEAERVVVEADRPGLLRGAAEVVGGTLSDIRGIPEAGLELLTGAAATAVGGAAAIPVTAVEAFRGGEDPAGAGRSIIEEFQERFTFQPRTEPGKRAAEAIVAPFGALERLADTIGEVTGDPDDVLGATAVKTAILGAPALFQLRSVARRTTAQRISETGQRATQAATQATERIAAKFREQAKPPTVDELFKKGSAAFRKADEAGVRVKAESSEAFAQRVTARLAEEGIDPILHPKSTQALRRITEDTEGGLSFKQIETLRRIAKDAAASIERPDRRFGRQIIEEIDDYIGQLDGGQATGNVQLAQRSITAARDFWSRARKGEMLEGLVDRAGVRAGQFTGSGFENALRTEFRQLSLSPKRLRGFSQAEIAAIRKVAEGGPITNALRFVGKFAPRGVISTAITAGGGATIGGPLGAILLTTGAEAARFAATKATRGAAQTAAEVARRGGQ